jgi:hypothetical protein
MDQSEATAPNDEPKDALARKQKRFAWRAAVLCQGGFLFLSMTLIEWYGKGYIRVPPLRPLLWSTIPSLICAGYFAGLVLWTHRRNPDL